MMEHFNPNREPELAPTKPCPFCHCEFHYIVDGERICYRCERIIENKENQKNEDVSFVDPCKGG